MQSPFSSQKLKKLRSYGNQNLFRCPETRALLALPLPTAEEFAAVYTEAYFSGDRYQSQPSDENFDTSSWTVWKRRLKTLQNLVRTTGEPPSLLDIGAGTGKFAQFAVSNGWSADLVEYSETGRQEIGHRIPEARSISKEFDPESFEPHSFDFITLWAVLEHMPYDPLRFTTLRRLLKPGGILAISLPNPQTLNRYLFGQRWRYFLPVEHLVFYPPGLLKNLLEQAGFETVDRRSYFSFPAFREGIDQSWLRMLPSPVKNASGVICANVNKIFWHGDTFEIYVRVPTPDDKPQERAQQSSIR